MADCAPPRLRVPAPVRDRHVLALTVTARGAPAPQGSKRHVGGGRMVEMSKTVRPWREHVQAAAEDAIAAMSPPPGAFPLVGAVASEVTFTVRKPLGAPKRRRSWPSRSPDLDKLVRAVNDALTAAGVWGSDAQVIEQTARKVFPNEHAAALHVPGVVIAVYAVKDPEELYG